MFQGSSNSDVVHIDEMGFFMNHHLQSFQEDKSTCPKVHRTAVVA